MSSRPTSRPPGFTRRHRESGFTLAEVLLVTVLVGVGLVGVSWLMTMAAQTQAVHAESSSETIVVAREIRELAETLTRTPSGTGAATTYAEVTALDNLDGARFSPPIRADGVDFSGFAGWTQVVDISVRHVDDPTVVVDAGAPELVKGAGTVYLLQVDVQEGGSVLATHEWWIQP